MFRSTRLAFGLVPLALASLLTTGCGGGGTAVTGKLVLPKGVQLESDDQVEITFVPEDPNGRPAAATVNDADLTFVVHGADEAGIAPGKYKIAVHVTPYPGPKSHEKRLRALDAGLNKFFAAPATKLSYEVTPGADNRITIDLATGTVTKG